MLTGLSWLVHKAKSLEPAWAFYEEMLELPVSERGDNEFVAAAGETDLVLLRTSGLTAVTGRKISRPARSRTARLTRTRR
ncbi:hypothetical protein C486_16163 [Natrinema gari JCM 14663]|uniref:Glyoxalase/bleomycin resistance protein/dioxygenase n=1 Tax=Natrinema gari JCM 14663 TaxID=1230459 RepID=L9YSX6_9EURY|nr:hypothetical protein C486_16163 [Natrinema gari JCM 14663]